VIDGVLCSEQQKRTKQNATEKWFIMVGARLPKLIVSGVPGYRLGYPWIIPLRAWMPQGKRPWRPLQEECSSHELCGGKRIRVIVTRWRWNVVSQKVFYPREYRMHLDIYGHWSSNQAVVNLDYSLLVVLIFLVL